MTPPPVVILAGGASRRMGGGAKPLLLLGGRSLISRIIDRIEPQAGPMAINTNAADKGYQALGLPLLPDVVADRRGPLAGILTAMDWAIATGHTHVATVPGDTPFLPGDLIPQLLLCSETADAVPVLAASGGRVHPVAGLWPAMLRDRLATALAAGTRRMTDWTESVDAATVDFPATTPDQFFNVNTPEDLATAEAALNHSS